MIRNISIYSALSGLGLFMLAVTGVASRFFGNGGLILVWALALTALISAFYLPRSYALITGAAGILILLWSAVAIFNHEKNVSENKRLIHLLAQKALANLHSETGKKE